MTLKIILLGFIVFNSIQAELYWFGEINLQYNSYLKNFKNTENPIRFGKFNIGYAISDFEFKSNTALEYNWNNSNASLINFREYYFSYYPSFGEVHIGKQIITWGFADGTNPTDNINPYDLNYMFENGVDRKIGIHSISSLIYYNDIKMNFVLCYDNVKNIKNNRLPLPLPENNNDKILEYGFDFQYNMNDAEFNLSYLMKKNIPIMIPNDVIQTNVHTLGINFLYLYNDITFRTENAIFMGQNNEKFYQGIIQLELPTLFESTIGTQIFGTYNIDNSASGLYGIGSPIFYFTEVSPIFATSVSKAFNDETIEINLFTMFEILDGYGSSLGFEMHYDILDNLKSKIGISKFLKGNNESFFNYLVDYSSININIEYSF
ncbi:MAG: hypothetical protein CMG24_06700 [Candidatus Marinimicrobia bacterium]|nr:hypothetical protein [Candidatus Neomarinimicrobiota bacterium]